MRRHNYLRLTALLQLALLCIIVSMAFDVSAQGTVKQQRTYSEVIMDNTTNDPKAQAIVEKLLVDDIDMMRQFDNTAPGFSAQFISLGPNLPKTAILAYVSHSSVCGSSGCRTLVFVPTQDGKYNIVFDTTVGRVFLNLRAGNTHYDILTIVMPRATDGFGVFFWNAEKNVFVFSGISRFSKP